MVPRPISCIFVGMYGSRISLALLASLVWAVACGQLANVRVGGLVSDEDSGVPIKVFTVVAADPTLEHGYIDGVLDARGRYELRLPYDHVYLITVSAEGYWPKKVLVDLNGIPSNLRTAGFVLAVDIRLMRPFLLNDTTLLELPMGRATYDPRKRNMKWDASYSAPIRKRWKAARKSGAEGGE